MITITITAFYAGLTALLFIGVSYHVSHLRIRTRVSSGDGGEKALAKAIRVQGNFAEYAPLALILLTLGELQGASGWALHVLGIMFVCGRILHMVGYGRTPQIPRLRQVGMVLTYSMITFAGFLNLARAIF